MRKVILAIVVAASAITGMATSASAQGVYLGFGGGSGYDRSYDNGYRSYGNGYRSYDNGYRSYDNGTRYYSDSGYRRSYTRAYASTCRVKRVWVGDHYRRVRRCY